CRSDVGGGLTERTTEVEVRVGEGAGNVERAALAARRGLRRGDRSTEDDQLFVLTDRGDQATGGVGAVDGDDVPGATAPLRRGERDAGQGQGRDLRADFDVAQDELGAERQQVAVVPAAAGLREDVVGRRGGAVVRRASAGPQLQRHAVVGFDPALVAETDRVTVPVQLLRPGREQRDQAGIHLAEDESQVVVLALGRSAVLDTNTALRVPLRQLFRLLEDGRDGRTDPAVGHDVVGRTRLRQTTVVNLRGTELRALDYREDSHAGLTLPLFVGKRHDGPRPTARQDSSQLAQ